MLAAVLPWVADALVLLGLVTMSLAVWGILRMPDLYSKLHASSKMTVLGLAPLVLAAGVNNGTILLRGLLVMAFLLLTAPVSSAAIARAYWRRHPDEDAPQPNRPAPHAQAAPAGDHTPTPD